MNDLKQLTVFFQQALARPLLAAVCVCLMSLSMADANAAGLGRMRVLSALGAPFSAEVELTNFKPEDENNMVVRIANAELFKQAGIDYNPALAGIFASISKDKASPSIVLSSSSPIGEPLLEILLEVSWQSGRLVRQYTVLLDPINPVNEAPAANNEPVQAPSSQIASTPASTPLPVAQPSAEPVAKKPYTNEANAAGASSYDVRRGDTLYGIASRLSGTDAHQINALMALLLQNNPHAFDDNDINRLKTGVVLNTAGVGTGTIGNGMFKAGGGSGASQRKFEQYKQGSSKKAKTLASKKTGSKSVKNTVKTEAQNKPVATQDQLKVSGNAAVGNQSKKTADLAQTNATSAAKDAAKEAAIAKNRAIAEEKARIAELEKSIKKSIDIKNNLVTSPQALPAVDTTNKMTPPAGAANKSQPALTLSSAPAAAPNTPSMPAPAAPAAVAPAAAPAQATVAAPTPAKPKTPAVEEPAWYESLDPLTLGGLGGVAALVGAWFVYRRKKNNENAEFSDSTFNSKDTQGGLLTQDGGQAVDTFNSVFVSNFSEANSPLEASEVDPVAEADVYMQYGRDAHAEDILKDALKQNPTRHAVRLKLMELYASKNNQQGLSAQFDMLSQLTQSSGDDWKAGKQLFEKTMGAKASNSPNQPMNTAASVLRSNAPSVPYSAPTMIGDVADLPDMKTNFNASPMITALAPNQDQSVTNSKPNSSGLSFHLQSPTMMLAPGVVGLNPQGAQGSLSGAASPDMPSLQQNSVLEFTMSQASAPAMQSNATTAMFNQANLGAPNAVSNFSALETKLNLAKAYTDIGDKEGARELLQEIVEAGHQSLSEQAKGLLAKL